MSASLLREVVAVQRDGHDVLLRVQALAAVQLPGTPGWLTGEDLAEQGVETTMPNLPDLVLPERTGPTWLLRVQVAAQDTVRLLLSPEDTDRHPERRDPCWLGIVTDARPDPEAAGEAVVEEHLDRVVVRTSELRVVVGRTPFTLQVQDRRGRTLLRTAERLRQVAGFPTAPAVLVEPGRTTVNLELGTDEDVTGFGERFGRSLANGQRLRLRVEDALGTGTGLSYKPVPVWHSSSGWTGFLNTGTTVVADVGHTRPSVVALEVEDEALDLYVVVGPDPRRRLTAYTALTGRGPRPPLWAFGYWMGRCRYHSAEEMLEVARTMRRHEVPADVLHLDPDWLIVDRLNTDFVWNTDRFGDRAAFVADLAEAGFRLSVWELPYLDPASPLYPEAEAEGHLVRTVTGAVAGLRGTPTPDGRPRAVIDLTRPETVRWWQDMHAPFLADGVAVFKTDFGEGLPDDAALSDGTPPEHAHNLFPLRYNGAVSDGIARLTGRAPLVWGRSGWAGSHRYPGQWGGDAESTVSGMQATVRGGLSYAVSAPGFWSHDIGGFFGPELTPELYLRWTQLGALSPLMRAHGLRPREPWQFGEATLHLARTWIRRRYELLPYLWQVATESAALGLPVLRPLTLEHPEDPVAATVDGQFLLGRDLLVVPVFNDAAEPVRRRVYVPEGCWRDLWSDLVLDGPGFHDVDVALSDMPVLVRDGAVVPTVDVTEDVRRTDDLVGRPWRLVVAGDSPTEGTCTHLVGFDDTDVHVRWGTDGVVDPDHGSASGQPVHRSVRRL